MKKNDLVCLYELDFLVILSQITPLARALKTSISL